MRFCPWS